jgi:outer membrane protein OmpA-like peptidoglycan-associated protein
MKSRALIFICIIFSIHHLVAEQFVFKYAKGEKYKILVEVFEKVYYDEKLHHSAEILDKASITIDDVKGKKGHLIGVFEVSEKVDREDVSYRKKDEEFLTKYWCDEKGNYEMSPRTLYPLTRNIPYFPKSEIKVGTSWEAPAEEIHDFEPYGFKTPIHIPITVKYIYESNDESKDKKIAVINAGYEVYRELTELIEFPGIHPIVILGKIGQKIHWDIEKGRVDSYEDDFHFVYQFNNGEVIDFIGTSKGEFIESPEMNKKKMEEEIRKDLENEKIEDATVKSDESGVTISLEDIHFKAESDVLMPEEQKKLEKIGSILKKYPGRDLFIAGHTAFAGTEEGRQTLSEKRAKSVADYLLMLGVRKENQVTYKGFGGRFPVAENKTEEGMKKNRRVEIKILEN